MSRVTIGDITEDLVPFTEKGNKVVNVEIVPRKIVEDIIKQCQRWENAFKNAETISSWYINPQNKNMKLTYEAKAMAYRMVIEYARGLLAEFESDGKLNGRNFEQAWKEEKE